MLRNEINSSSNSSSSSSFESLDTTGYPKYNALRRGKRNLLNHFNDLIKLDDFKTTLNKKEEINLYL